MSRPLTFTFTSEITAKKNKAEKNLVEQTAMSASVVEKRDGDDEENGEENEQQNKDGQRE